MRTARHAVSMLCAIPIALLSDRLGCAPWGILMAGAAMVTTGAIMLALTHGSLVRGCSDYRRHDARRLHGNHDDFYD